MPTYLDLLNEARGLHRFLQLNANELTPINGEAVIGAQAVNRVVQNIRTSSIDFDYSEPVRTIQTVANNQVLTSPTDDDTWNPQMIREMRRVSATEYVELPEVTLPRAKELEFSFNTPGKPLYYYVNQGEVRVIPEPDQEYDLQIIYQSALKTIDITGLTADVIEPPDLHDTMVTGIFAHLRRAEGDPEWSNIWENQYKVALNKAIIRNKSSKKAKGKRLFRMRRSVDRRL